MILGSPHFIPKKSKGYGMMSNFVVVNLFSSTIWAVKVELWFFQKCWWNKKSTITKWLLNNDDDKIYTGLSTETQSVFYADKGISMYDIMAV